MNDQATYAGAHTHVYRQHPNPSWPDHLACKICGMAIHKGLEPAARNAGAKVERKPSPDGVEAKAVELLIDGIRKLIKMDGRKAVARAITSGIREPLDSCYIHDADIAAEMILDKDLPLLDVLFPDWEWTEVLGVESIAFEDGSILMRGNAYSGVSDAAEAV